MLQVSEKEIVERMGFDNPWWSETGGIEVRWKELPPRDYLPSFLKLAKEKEVVRALVLMGPRRVGKTVMIQHAIQRLIDEGVDTKSIAYFSLDTPIYTGLSLEYLLGLFKQQFDHNRKNGLFIFFDEIQYLKNWEIHLKSLVDSFPSHKFIASGSAAAALRLKSQESGAGRFTDFFLPPLTFAEFIRFTNNENVITRGEGNGAESEQDGEDDFEEAREHVATDMELLNKLFIDYINFGGYPEAVFSEAVRTGGARFIKQDIIDKVLLRDLPSLYGISDIQELNRLFTTISYNTGQEVSLEKLSSASGVAKNTIKRYIEYLEAAFLIRRVFRIDQNARRFQRENFFKVYLTNPSMRAALFGPVDADSDAMGSLTETALFSQWLHAGEGMNSLFYARWSSGEVDIVQLGRSTQRPAWAVEVKWSDRVASHPEEASNLIRFAETHEMTDVPLMTTKTIRKIVQIGGTKIALVPAAEQIYTVGKNLLSFNPRI